MAVGECDFMISSCLNWFECCSSYIAWLLAYFRRESIVPVIPILHTAEFLKCPLGVQKGYSVFLSVRKNGHTYEHWQKPNWSSSNRKINAQHLTYLLLKVACLFINTFKCTLVKHSLEDEKYSRDGRTECYLQEGGSLVTSGWRGGNLLVSPQYSKTTNLVHGEYGGSLFLFVPNTWA